MQLRLKRIRPHPCQTRRQTFRNAARRIQRTGEFQPKLIFWKPREAGFIRQGQCMGGCYPTDGNGQQEIPVHRLHYFCASSQPSSTRSRQPQVGLWMNASSLSQAPGVDLMAETMPVR